MKGLLSVLVLLGFQFAYADQCAYIAEYGTTYGNSFNPEKTANDALEMLESASEFHFFCEPCGNLSPTPVEIGNLSIEVITEEGYPEYKVLNNGRTLDLAYIYADKKNVAIATGCKANGVSAEIN